VDIVQQVELEPSSVRTCLNSSGTRRRYASIDQASSGRRA
jgi:hypothetical protein